MKRVLTLLAVVLLTAVPAAGECPVPIPPGAMILTGWAVTRAGTPASAKEEGGVVRVGENPDSVATKSFDCGSKGGNCNLTFPVSAPTGATDQSMTVRFRYRVSGDWKHRTIRFHRQPGAGNPVRISLPACGKTEVRVMGDPAGKAKMESPFAAGPFYAECRDCKLKERGTEGN